MSKKVISLLLAVMLTASMITVAAVSVSADTEDDGKYIPSEGTETNRYYFYMPSDWINEYSSVAGIYWWSGSDAPDSWPGYVASNDDAAGVYYCDVPNDTNAIIWNNAFDGGNDSDAAEYSKAMQTVDIGVESYDEGESDLYPAGLENFDNMIYVINPDDVFVSDRGKTTCGGEWYYYYGNGEYGVQPTRDEAIAAGSLFNTEYQPQTSLYDTAEFTEAVTEAPAEETTESAKTEIKTETSNEEITELSEEPNMISEGPFLTLNATSNYFPTSVTKYNKETNQVTVTYYFQASKDVLDTQWYMYYDPAVLSPKAANNKPNDICPSFGASAGPVNLKATGDTPERRSVKYSATNLYLSDFSSSKQAFASIVFDVVAESPVTTTVDLFVDILRVSAIDEDTGMTSSAEEVMLLDRGIIFDNESTATVTTDRTTVVTPSTYVEPDTTDVPTTEELTTAVPTTEAPTTEVPTTAVPTTEVPTTAVPTDPYPAVLNLTVNATSNYFPEASAQYNPDTKEVVVTYNIQSSKNLLDTQWYLTYDPKVLSVSDKNTISSVSPAINSQGAVINMDIVHDGVGYVKFAASNLGLYDISTSKTPYATIIFDVNDISAVAPISTTVDLVVDVLRVSEIGDDGINNSDKEVLLVDNEVVLDNEMTATVRISTETILTPSTYVEPTTEKPTEAPTTEKPTEAPTTEAPTEAPTTEAPTDVPTTEAPTDAPATEVPTEAPTTEAPTDAPATEEPTEAPTTEAPTDAPATEVPTDVPSTEEPTIAPATDATSATGVTTPGSSTSDTPKAPGTSNGVVQTGDASLAVIILTLLIGATCVMFVLRKREMY